MGRVDFIGNRRIAAVVYMRRQHVINVFAWPAIGAAAAQPQIAAVKGCNALTWTARGIVHWALSDLNVGELKQSKRCSQRDRAT